MRGTMASTSALGIKNSSATSNRVRSAVLNMFRNTKGRSPLQVEQASIIFVVSAMEKTRTPFASNKWIVFLTGCSPSPHFWRTDRAAISGENHEKSSSAGSGKANFWSIQSENIKASDPAANAALRSIADMVDKLRKLTARSGGPSISSPEKKPIGKSKIRANRTIISSGGVISPLSYRKTVCGVSPSNSASLALVSLRRRRARLRRPGVNISIFAEYRCRYRDRRFLVTECLPHPIRQDLG